ncbi:sensor histidine kinase [Laceyella tengchongensis]|uniref:sensor histidine kinase n=1 Tax=Laceyella tengchongensis TaxID=574699 RepID=UPI0012B85649|nr:sensor histidine kinase [Laceyella tengchongensis]
MNHDKGVWLVALQFMAITGLVFADMSAYAPDQVRWISYLVLFFVAVLLLRERFRYAARLQAMVATLRMALDGNLKSRLFTNGDRLMDEFVFTANEMIERLEQVHIQAIRSQMARKSLLSSISHDIRTPLTSIIGYVDALKDGIAVSEEEKQAYTQIVSDKAKKLKDMIDEIFTMAKLDADEMPMKPERFDLAEVIRETLIGFLPIFKQQDITLQVDIPDRQCMILADRLSVVRIITNIIKNTVNYGAEGKVLGVELSETDGEFQALIWDRGPGIAEEEMENVFKRMYRGDQSRNPLRGGSGLGLAIAKALVEKNHGNIWVQSVPWERTVFGISFPKHMVKNDLRNR